MEKALLNIKQSVLNELNRNKGKIVNNEIIDLVLTAIMDTEEEIVKNKNDLSDGCHTFGELYYHRMILFNTICKTHKDKTWKSWKHDDGSMFNNSFIVGVDTPEGQYTYHYHKGFWDVFDVEELEFAPKYDGHQPKDITRLLSL